MQPISGNGKEQNTNFAYSSDSSLNRATESSPSVLPQRAQEDAGLFKVQHTAADIRFPGAQIALAPDAAPSDISKMYGLAEYPSLKSDSQSSPINRLPGIMARNVEPQAIPALAQSPRGVLPGSMMHEAFGRNHQADLANVSMVADSNNAHTQVWNQGVDQANQAINVDYLTSTPKQLNMPINQVKSEWDQGEFDTLSTTNSDALQGESVYLPWHQGARTAPGDWKVFANHMISKYNPEPTDKQTKISADLDKPFNYNFDSQNASIGAIEEKLHSKQFSVDEAQQVWNQGEWPNKLVGNPENHHAEELMGLPWNQDQSVHMLTWWRFLNELGGYKNP